MEQPYQTDTFFFTKQNFGDDPTLKFMQTVSKSLNKSTKGKKQELQQLYNNYSLFKYSKCFMPKHRLSVRQMAQTERDNNLHNFKSIKKESQKLKERLNCMEKERKLLLEKLRLHK